MVSKYKNCILLALVMFIFPSFIGKTGNTGSETGNEAYLNWETIHLRGEIEEFRAFNKGINRFGEIIRQESEKSGWDWRLISAIIFRESGFNPRAYSPAGAAGLMQLMPVTVRSYGIGNVHDPVQNIRGGIRLLNWLNERFGDEIPDQKERMKFILASYNAGFSRISEARKTARKMGKNPNVWDDNVEFVFSDECRRMVRSGSGKLSGSCGSPETFDFVITVLGYYDRFSAFHPY